MDRLILRALPPTLRESHGSEIEEMLANTSRPVLDRADLLVAAVGLRVEVRTRTILAAAALSVVTFALALVAVVGGLQRGAVEIPSHWWSTLAAAGFALSATAASVIAVAQYRAASWRRRI